MKSNTFIGIALVFLSSCAGIGLNTGKQERQLKPHQKIEAMVNEGKFKEAKDLAASSGPKVQPYLGIKRIEASEKCRPVIDECNLDRPESQKVRQCLANLEQKCERKYLTQKYHKDLKKVLSKLIDYKDQDLVPSQAKGMCDDGMKWGYVRETDSKLFRKAFTHNIDFKTLHGQFSSKEKCEEARLLETEGIQTSNTCYTRYIGAIKSLTVYQAIGMQGTSKRTLTFKEKSLCDKAVQGGYTYHPAQSNPVTYFPIGSDQSNRFIKGCDKTQITICEQHKQGEQFLSDIL
jgi:hypothetical protein